MLFFLVYAGAVSITAILFLTVVAGAALGWHSDFLEKALNYALPTCGVFCLISIIVGPAACAQL